MTDPKELKKLAAACRAAGIKTYKSGDLEFTLNEEAPPSPYKKRKAKSSTTASNQDDGQKVVTEGWDDLSEEQKLFYSSRDPLFENEEDKH